MYRRTSGRRWRAKDLRGIPYEAVEPMAPSPAAQAHPAAVPVCLECGQPREDDPQVADGLACQDCAK
jgi:hypothetical protein